MNHKDQIKQLTLKALNVTMLTNRGENDPFYPQMKLLLEKVYKLGYGIGKEDAIEIMECQTELNYDNYMENMGGVQWNHWTKSSPPSPKILPSF